MIGDSKRDDVYEEWNFDLLGFIKTETGMLDVCYAPNWEVQGPRYFCITTVDEDGYLTEDSKRCRIYEDRPEYVTGVDDDRKLTKKEKELLIDFFKNGGDVRRIGYKTGWEAYVAAHNNDKGAGCFAEIPEEEKDNEDPIEAFPMPDFSLLETED